MSRKSKVTSASMTDIHVTRLSPLYHSQYNFWPDNPLTTIRQDIIMNNPIIVGINGDKGIGADSSKMLVRSASISQRNLWPH